MKRRDFQRKRVYDWEKTHVRRLCPGSDERLDEASAQALVDRVFRDHKRVDPPTVHIMGNRKRGNAGRWEIKLASHYPISTEQWYVLHEITHSLTLAFYYSEDIGGGHGPTFLRLYADLLARYANGMLPAVLGSMRGARLKVHDSLPVLVRLEEVQR